MNAEPPAAATPDGADGARADTGTADTGGADTGATGREPARVVDALGRACPLPVIWLAQAVDEVGLGDEVVVLADDPGAKVDIPVWCRMRRQDHLGTEETGSGWRFTVRRAT